MKQRLHYFDMLKGMAIFMVVMGHVMTMCVRQIDSTPLFKFIGQIHMPLFFFISGWFAWRATAPAIAPKIKRLLLPMFVVSTLWIYYFPVSGLESPLVSTWHGLWSDPFKNGYWFTPVLFEIIVIYAAAWRLLKRCRSLWAEICVSAGVWLVLILAMIFMPADLAGWLSWNFTTEFFAVFMAGVIASRHRDAFFRLCGNGNVVALCVVIVAVVMEFVCWPWRHAIEGDIVLMILRVTLQIALAVVGVAVVKPWSEKAYAPGAKAPFARMWEYIGTRSLAVYLLHYFFLFPMGSVRPALQSFGLSFVPMTVFSATVAAAIVAIVLALDYILSYAGPLSLLLTGTVNSKPSK